MAGSSLRHLTVLREYNHGGSEGKRENSKGEGERENEGKEGDGERVRQGKEKFEGRGYEEMGCERKDE